MAPSLRPGDHVLVDPRAFRGSAPQIGDVVLARHPHEPDRHVVKRVAAVSPSGIELRGDNPDLSTDSREFGPIDARDVLGKVVARFP